MFAVFLAAATLYVLVATRVAAFVLVSPFPGSTAPTTVKVGLVLLLAFAASPALGTQSAPPIGLPLVVAAFAEAATGAAIGFIFRVAASAADVLGSAVAHAMGLSMGGSFDPSLETETDPLARIVTTAAMVVAVGIGAHRVVFAALIASVHAVPIGAAPDAATLAPTLLAWIARAMDCGVGLALPAVTVSIAVQIALALVARAAPALQVFSVGLSVTLASGLLVVLSGAGGMLSGLAGLFGEMSGVFDAALSR